MGGVYFKGAETGRWLGAEDGYDPRDNTEPSIKIGPIGPGMDQPVE